MPTQPQNIAKLALEDGTIFTGTAFGAARTNPGEVVFNTSLVGYQEIITDPSYKGQLVTMTYPQIGNYGIADLSDYESARPQVEGFIIKELSPIDSNFRSVETLHAYLARYDIPGIAGIDTRALVRKLRIQGAMKGVICTDQSIVNDDAELVKQANAWPGMNGLDLVKIVIPEKPYEWNETKGTWAQITDHQSRATDHAPLVVAIDCGLKRNILRNLTQSGCKVTVLPAGVSADEILAHNPDGIFISNGPGDPEPVHYVQTALQKLIGKSPSSASASATSSSASPWARRPTNSSSATAAATSPSRTPAPEKSKSPPRTTASPSTPTPSKSAAGSPPTSTSTTKPSKASATPPNPSSPSNTTPKPPPAPTTPPTSSTASAK